MFKSAEIRPAKESFARIIRHWVFRRPAHTRELEPVDRPILHRLQLQCPYQFLALSSRPEVLQSQSATALKLIRGLVNANRWVLGSPGADIVKSMPEELVAGGDVEAFASVLDRYKMDLYPPDGLLQLDPVQRVVDVQTESGAIDPGRVHGHVEFDHVSFSYG